MQSDRWEALPPRRKRERGEKKGGADLADGSKQDSATAEENDEIRHNIEARAAKQRMPATLEVLIVPM